MVLATVIVLARARQRRREAHGVFETRGVDSRVRDDLDSLIVQMQEVAREQIAKADVKIRMLNQLMSEADQKKRELEALLGQSPPPKPPAPTRSIPPLHEKVYHLHDGGKSPDDISRELTMEIGEVEMILGLRHLQR